MEAGKGGERSHKRIGPNCTRTATAAVGNGEGGVEGGGGTSHNVAQTTLKRAYKKEFSLVQYEYK